MLNEFEFNIQYIPGDTNELAGTLSRVYSDEPKDVIRAQSKFVDEGDDVETRAMPIIHFVYVETYLLAVMNMEMRGSSRLANKPAPRYKETRDRGPKKEVNGAQEKTQDEPEVTEQAAEPDPINNATEHTEPVVNNVPTGNRLFEVSSDLGISFTSCIEGWYDEDAFFKPALANPEGMDSCSSSPRGSKRSRSLMSK